MKHELCCARYDAVHLQWKELVESSKLAKFVSELQCSLNSKRAMISLKAKFENGKYKGLSHAQK